MGIEQQLCFHSFVKVEWWSKVNHLLPGMNPSSRWQGSAPVSITSYFFPSVQPQRQYLIVHKINNSWVAKLHVDRGIPTDRKGWGGAERMPTSLLLFFFISVCWSRWDSSSFELVYLGTKSSSALGRSTDTETWCSARSANKDLLD